MKEECFTEFSLHMCFNIWSRPHRGSEGWQYYCLTHKSTAAPIIVSATDDRLPGKWDEWSVVLSDQSDNSVLTVTRRQRANQTMPSPKPTASTRYSPKSPEGLLASSSEVSFTNWTCLFVFLRVSHQESLFAMLPLVHFQLPNLLAYLSTRKLGMDSVSWQTKTILTYSYCVCYSYSAYPTLS